MPSGLLAVILILIPAFVPSPVQAQTSNPQEITSRDVEPTFKLQTERNLVLVRVVVRDATGAPVDNLRQEDFRLFDHGKLQTILHFSMEKPALKASVPVPAKPAEKTTAEPEDVDEASPAVATARRFVALYFDDVNTPFENLSRTRAAADHYLTKSMQTGDRIALFTSSGQKQVDFTDDLAKLRQALLDLRPRPIIEQDRTCPWIPPYEADLIVNKSDPAAIAVAIDEYTTCNAPPAATAQQAQMNLSLAQNQVQNLAMQSLEKGEVQSRAALRGIESIVRILTAFPGQRSMVIVSGGFLTETLQFELNEITDRALRSGVILNAIDARGLYTDTVYDASQSNFAVTQNPQIMGQKQQILTDSDRAQTDGMRSLALDTGGIFFNNSNDLDAGFNKTAGLPGTYYILAFSPQNLKLDGSFHPLQVKLVASKGLAVQARRGYYAPKKPSDPTVQEKEEIQEAVYSQDETHELPIDVHTQFFMKTETDAQIAVLTRIDLRPLHLRKEADRNLDTLTFVTVLFDRDGHVVTGQQKSVELHMHDSTLEKYLQTGIVVRTRFDVKPGTYLVRAIVRDAESGQIAGLNRTVEIPY
ncbi:MAG: VWA domain-containing protein [Terriglobia bacterium]